MSLTECARSAWRVTIPSPMPTKDVRSRESITAPRRPQFPEHVPAVSVALGCSAWAMRLRVPPPPPSGNAVDNL